MLRLTDFIIDCPDPMALAAFYAAVTGREVAATSREEWASVVFGDIELACYKVDDYTPPSWPGDEHPKQFHLDFEVDEFAPERERIEALGAVHLKDFVNDEGYGWQVYTDPVGHPFCLCRNPGYDWSE